MVTVNQIEKGLASYMDSELGTMLPENTIQKVIAATALSLAIRKSGALIQNLQAQPFVKMLDIFDAEGNLDIDTLAEELKKNMTDKGFDFEIPMLGMVTFKKADIDKLREHITMN